jgi:hypothetical protein
LLNDAFSYKVNSARIIVVCMHGCMCCHDRKSNLWIFIVRNLVHVMPIISICNGEMMMMMMMIQYII